MVIILFADKKNPTRLHPACRDCETRVERDLTDNSDDTCDMQDEERDCARANDYEKKHPKWKDE